MASHAIDSARLVYESLIYYRFSGIRTHTTRILSASTLPVGLQTVFTALPRFEQGTGDLESPRLPITT